MAQTQVWYDREGDIVHRYELTPSGRITRTRFSANGRRVLEENKALRQSDIPRRKSEFVNEAFQIPGNVYHRLLAQNPELNCWDQDVRSRAWNKFLLSKQAETFRYR